MQATSGAIVDDDRRLPVTGGTLQTTFQAAQTWRQAYARTADASGCRPCGALRRTSPRRSRPGRRRAGARICRI